MSTMAFQGGVIFRTFVPNSGFGTLKVLRLPVLNETHTNSYTGPILDYYYFNNVFVQVHTKESQKLQKVNIRMGAKRAVMKKRTVTHVQVKIVMKRRNQT